MQYARSKWVFPFGSESCWATNHAKHWLNVRAKLVLGDLNEPGLENVVTEIRKAGGYVWFN